MVTRRPPGERESRGSVLSLSRWRHNDNNNDNNNNNNSNNNNNNNDDDNNNNNNNNNSNNNNDNNNNNRTERRSSRFFFTISSLRREPSPTRTLRWPGRNRVQITCNTSSAYQVQHVVIRATWYEGTAQLLSLTELT